MVSDLAVKSCKLSNTSGGYCLDLRLLSNSSIFFKVRFKLFHLKDPRTTVKTVLRYDVICRAVFCLKMCLNLTNKPPPKTVVKLSDLLKAGLKNSEKDSEEHSSCTAQGSQRLACLR